MTTKPLQSILACCAWLAFALPASADLAPTGLRSITITFDGTDAKYPDDLDPFTEELSKEDLTTGPFRYEKTGENTGDLWFTNWNEGSETYTGVFKLTFRSATSGTFHKTYTGTYTGYILGNFVISAMDATEPPLASAKTVRMESGEVAKFMLKGEAQDVRKSGLSFKITEAPKSGKLNTAKLPKVTYEPKPGFKGKDKFSFIVKEGKTASKPATVKLVVK